METTETVTEAETLAETLAKSKEENAKRVGEFAASIFEDLGFGGNLPDGLVDTYKGFKKTKNTLSPGGRLSPESFATIVALYELKKVWD